MAKIFRTKNQPARSRLLLRIGLSIFLFLLIQGPQGAISKFGHLNDLPARHWSSGKKNLHKPREVKPGRTVFCQEVAFLAKIQP